MEIIQVAMKMSDEAARGIADGTMVRHGGVVYRTTGGIVEHLDDVIVSTVAKEKPVDQASGSIISSVANHLENPKILIAIGLGVLLAGGVVCYVKGKNKKNTKNNVEIELHKCIAGYNDSVVAYLDAINNGNVSLDKINCVIRSIDTLRENKEITIDFAQEKSETLVNYVYDYTRKLAEANSFELIDLKKSNPCSVDNTLIDLRLFLETQKNIFEKAA